MATDLEWLRPLAERIDKLIQDVGLPYFRDRVEKWLDELGAARKVRDDWIKRQHEYAVANETDDPTADVVFVPDPTSPRGYRGVLCWMPDELERNEPIEPRGPLPVPADSDPTINAKFAALAAIRDVLISGDKIKPKPANDDEVGELSIRWSPYTHLTRHAVFSLNETADLYTLKRWHDNLIATLRAATRANALLAQVDDFTPAGWEGPSPDRVLDSVVALSTWVKDELLIANTLADRQQRRGSFYVEQLNAALRNAFRAITRLRIPPPWPQPEATADPLEAERRLSNLVLELDGLSAEIDANPAASGDQVDPTGVSSGERRLKGGDEKPVKSKRSTNRGDAEKLLIGAFLTWHGYDAANNGSCKKYEPVNANQLARDARILPADRRSGSSSASRFFNRWFGDPDNKKSGYTRYKAICADRNRHHVLIANCRAMAGDLIPARMIPAGSDPTEPRPDEE